ncbi:MAG: fused MFS/spermidine synthase [Patescibacteria group bacterium]
MKKFFLYLTVFITGMCVMAIEMTASRFLAPFFGASILVWSSIIGVVMAALALGYFYGGKFADHYGNSTKPLFLVIFITGIFVDLVAFFGRSLLRDFALSAGGDSFGVIFGSLFATVILFAIPLIFLGMVSPMAARIGVEKNTDNVGSVVGNLYAFSTVGSLFGVFLPALVMIPFIGTARTFIVFGTVLILLGAAGLRSIIALLAVIISAVLALSVPVTLYADNPAVIAEVESSYNTIHVREDGDGTRYMVINDGRGVQSQYREGEVLTGRYWDAVALGPLLNPEIKNMLVLGVAGGTSLRVAHHFYPELIIDGVDVDEAVFDLAKRFFALPQDDNVRLFASDGRLFVAEKENDSYDFVMIDTYTKEIDIPFHLATREFFHDIDRVLSSSGIMLINIAVMGSRTEVAEAITNTVAEVFPHTYHFWFPGTSSWLVFASNEDFMKDAVNVNRVPDPRLASIFSQFKKDAVVVSHNPQAMYFTDDRAPIELLSRL